MPLPGTYNGPIIKWYSPINKKFVFFEWDADYQYGPHYHVMWLEDYGKHNEEVHFHAGDPVPEPWNTIFFGGQ